jgi:succinate dehydrogenase/fumarate reductase flavoprotein subunit
MKLSDKTAISMPMRNLIGIITAVSVGVWAFFGIQETLNKHSTTLELMEKDLEQNSEFRIKYPRGELGQSAGEAELFMLVEHMAGQVSKIEDRMENMMSNSVNIERLQKDMEKVLSDIEKLKDKQRSFANGTR